MHLVVFSGRSAVTRPGGGPPCGVLFMRSLLKRLYRRFQGAPYSIQELIVSSLILLPLVCFVLLYRLLSA
jgi:hypothetical protein